MKAHPSLRRVLSETSKQLRFLAIKKTKVWIWYAEFLSKFVSKHENRSIWNWWSPRDCLNFSLRHSIIGHQHWFWHEIYRANFKANLCFWITDDPFAVKTYEMAQNSIPLRYVSIFGFLVISRSPIYCWKLNCLSFRRQRTSQADGTTICIWRVTNWFW